ncbi:MAG: oxygenase MpaB family protein [Naasia sp.]
MELYREVAGESILLAGGGRALLLQLAHPSVARGVAEHSRFAEDPTRRLVGTVDYLYTLAFGTEEQIARAARRVGGAHRGVRSESGPHSYDARDSDLQLWVAATLYDSTIVMYELAWGPLPEHAAEIVYRRSARIGTALGMPADRWPATRAAFAEYWDERIATIEVTPVARRVARELLRPARPQPWLRPVLPLARVVTAGLLPPRIRSGYGIRWTDRREALYRSRLGGLLRVYRALPRIVRTAPAATSRRGRETLAG